MIKIKKFKNFSTFYQRIDAFAVQVYSSVKIFKSNIFYDDTPQFYFRKISKTITAIYYETGEKPKLYRLDNDKTFLICKHFKLFKKDFIFAFILIKPAILAFFLPMGLISCLFFHEAIIEYIVYAIFIVLFFLIIDLSSIIKLLDFFDDIANEENQGTVRNH